jgi:hypothetical protein
LDLEVLKQSARKRGRRVVEQGEVNLYYNKEVCDVVVNDRVGFTADASGDVTAVYDDMYTSQYADVMADYFEDLGEIKGLSSYHVVSRIDTTREVTVSVEGY